VNNKSAILIVDDERRMLRSMKALLDGQGYLIATAASAGEACERLPRHCFDLVLLDMVLPDLDGLEVLRRVKELSPATSVIIITGHASMETAIESLKRGAYDYLRKPLEPEELILRVRHALERKSAEEQLQRTLKKLRKAMGATIHAITSTVEARDPYTAGHQQRVANLARAIGQEMQLSEGEIDGIRMAGSIHDMGKINIPAEILSKPGHISELELNLIRTHAQNAFDILKEIEFEWPVAEIVYQHHEKVDGSGYPRGLHGEEVILPARVLTVSDVVEAIASHRPYRPALGLQAALAEISDNRGTRYDARAVDACMRLFTEKHFCLDRAEAEAQPQAQAGPAA
jgi:putative two-component system response regulator